MRALDFLIPENVGTILVLGAALLLYVASRAALDALIRDLDIGMGRRALAHWLPVAAVALMATVLQRPEIAVGVIFATSVASLSLVVGIVSFVAAPRQAQVGSSDRSIGFPIEPTGDPPGPVAAEPAEASVSRLWPFVLPAALIALIAGFSARLTWIHAMALTMQGLILLPLVQAETERLPGVHETRERMDGWRRWELVLALALAALGAWAAVEGAVRVSGSLRVFSTGLIAATMLSPLLVLPMVAASVALAHRRRESVATGTSVGVVLLNLCLLLPAVILLSYVVPELHVWSTRLFDPVTSADLSPATLPALAEAPAPRLVFPIAVWRIDTVLLIVLGLVLIPVALGRWTLGRGEGIALILGYGIYIVLATIMGIR